MKKNSTKYFFLLLLFVYLFIVYDVNFHGPDEPIYFSYTASVVEDGDLNVINQKNEYSNFGKVISKTYNMPNLRDHGGTLLWVPFYCYAKSIYSVAGKFNLTGLIAYGLDKLAKCVMSFSTVIFGFFTFLFTYLLSRVFFSNKIALWSTLIMFFGTPFFYFTLFEVGNANIIGSLFAILSIWFGSYMVNMKKVHWFLYGVFFAICVIVKIDLLFQIIFISTFFLTLCFFKKISWKNGIYFILGFMPMFILKAINFHLQTGMSFKENIRDLCHIFLNLKYFCWFNGLFSSYRGLFYTSPVLYFCLIGFILIGVNILRNYKNITAEKRIQDIFFFALVCCLAAKLIFISWHFKEGYNLAARLMLTEFPICVLLSAWFIHGRKKYFKFLTGVISVLFVFWNLLIISEFLAGLDWIYITGMPGINVRLKSIKYIFDLLFYINNLGIKLIVCLPLLLVVSGVIFFIKSKFVNIISHPFCDTKDLNKNGLLGFLKIFTIYLCFAYVIITLLNVYNNKRNTEKLKLTGFFEDAIEVKFQEFKHEDFLSLLIGMSQYYGLKGNIDKINDIDRLKGEFFRKREQIKFYSEYTKPYHILGDSYKRKSNNKRAIECYQEIIRLNPDNVDAYISLGDIYSIEGDYYKAIDCFQRGIRLTPRAIYIYNRLGDIYAKIGDYDKAIEAYNKIIQIRPSCAVAYFGLGCIYKEINNYDKAIEFFQKSLQLNFASADIYRSLGDIYRSQGSYEKAVDYYQQFLQLNPKNADAYRSLGDIYRSQGSDEKAGDYYRQFLQLNPKNADVYRSLGDIYRSQGSDEKAVDYYQRSLQLNPASADVYRSLGDIYRSQGSDEKAVDYYQQSLQFNSKNPDVYRSLGDVYNHKGDKENALKQWNKLRELKRNNLINK